VGTGRVAIPLARCGVPVIEVESSVRMLSLLRQRVNGLPILVVHGDFVEMSYGGYPTATLAYAVFNTFMLRGRRQQEACLQRLRTALAPGGALTVEVLVPMPDRFERQQEILIRSLTIDEVLLQVARHDADGRRIDFQGIRFRHDKPVELIPTEVHYLWPEELDELAAGCGFQLKERFNHVSIYQMI
jgi:hypothetical protein